MIILYNIFMGIALCIVLYSALYDFFRLRIPNYIPVALVVVFFITFTLAHVYNMPVFQPLINHLMIGGLTFILMFTAFAFKLMGGGDAKIIPALALWFGSDGLVYFLLWTALWGFPLALTAIILRKTKLGNRLSKTLSSHKILDKGWIKALANGENVVPYGIAIAAGAVMTFIKLDYLP